MKKNIKALIKIILYMFIGAILGGPLSYSSARFNIFDLIESLGDRIIKNSYIIFLFWSLGTLAFIVSFYVLGKRKVENSLANDDEFIDDNFLSMALIISEAYPMISLSLYLINLYSAYLERLNDFMLITLIFIITNLIMAMIQHFIVEFIKTYNPEKQGDVVNLNFTKKWLESSDEREKLEMFEAGYKAFHNMQYAIIIMLVAFAIYTVMKQKGIAIILSLTSLYLVGIFSYFSVIQKKKDRK